MSVVFILLAASLTVAVGFLGAFLWSVKSGQYEDDYTPSVRMLFDEELHPARPGGEPAPGLSTTPREKPERRSHLPSPPLS